ncbi:MAG: methyl-accepting chemotaxis protein [Deltaproteobacteria bacterium]
MKWFANMKIGIKLVSGFILVALVTGLVGYLGIKNIDTITTADTRLYEKTTVPLDYIGTISANFEQVMTATRDIALAPDMQKAGAIDQQIQAARATMNQNVELYNKTITTQEQKDAMAAFQQTRTIYVPYMNQIIDLAKQGKNSEAAALLTDEKVLATADNERQAIHKLVVINEALAKEQAAQNAATAASATRQMLIFIVLAVAMAVGLGMLISRVITRPINQLVDAADQLAVGNVDVKVESLSRDEIGILMNSFSQMVDNIKAQASLAQNIAAGNMNVTCEIRSDKDVMGQSLKAMLETINAASEEILALVAATEQGNLEVRGNAGSFPGAWGQLIAAVNRLIDAMVAPINMTAEYIDGIARGDIPSKITAEYNGDFNKIKNNLNTCIAAVNLLIADSNMLAQAAVEGRLDTRADASHHQGDFRAIVDGVNHTLDAVIEPINEASAVLYQMSQGNLQQRVEGDYRGGHAAVKNALNDTLEILSSYIQEIASVLQEMSRGNLDVSIVRDYRGDFIAMKDAINNILASFNNTMDEINNAAEQVASGSGQVSDGSQSLSQAATEQASSIQQITASITDIAAQTRQNALKANQANDLAISAAGQAGEGDQQMQEMLRAMEDINESSNNISKIIKVIDEIAFQTNILALNAAVEAARAGQQGKGFAVVAEEVRNLAARSANAAKETTMMIEGSIKKVDTGTQIARTTASALGDIVNGVKQVTDLVADIAVASNDQATAIAQINQGITQVADVIQMNTAISEESAAASQQLASQAELLKTRIARFNLKKSVGPTVFPNVHPEIARMLQRLEAASDPELKKVVENNAAPKIQIALDDHEFGKY